MAEYLTILIIVTIDLLHNIKPYTCTVNSIFCVSVRVGFVTINKFISTTYYMY